MSQGLLGKIVETAEKPNSPCGASYKEALRDAEEFWRLWHKLSDDVPKKKELRDEYLRVMNLPDASK